MEDIISKERLEELINDLKEEIHFMRQYRLLTNQICYEHISQHDIDDFKEQEAIYYLDKQLFDDYDYDLFKFIYIKNWEEAVNVLEKLKESDK